MANRYTNLGYSTSLDIPLLQMPFQQLDALLGSYQKSKDDVGSLVTRDFANLKEDQELADQVREYQKSVKDQLIANFERGNADAYMASLRSAKTALDDLRSPSGAINALESRVKQKQARDKRIREFYKDVPEWAEYFTSTTPLPDINYSTTSRTYNPISENLPLPKYIDPADIESTAQKAVSSLKDSLLKEGYSKKQLDNITTLHDFYKLKGITADRIQSALLGTMNDEQLKSLVTQENVDRYRSGNKPDATVSDIYPFDDKGNFQSNFLGRMYQNKIKANIRKDITHDRIKDNNELALHRAKKQIDEELSFTTNRTFVTQVYDTKNAPKLSNILIPKEGGHSITGQTSFGQKGVQELKISNTKKKEFFFDQFNKIKQGKYDNGIGGASMIANKYSDEIESLAAQGKFKEASELFEKQYQDFAEKHGRTDVVIQQYDGDAMSKQSKRVFKNGNINKFNSFQILSSDANDTMTGSISLETVADNLGFDNVQEFLEANKEFGTVTGMSNGSNFANVASGEFMRVVDANGNRAEIMGSVNSIEEENALNPIRNLSAPLYKATESDVIYDIPLIPEFSQQFPQGVKSVPKPITKKDRLLDTQFNLEMQLRNAQMNPGIMTPDEQEKLQNQVNKIESELDKVENNPKLNTIDEYDIELINMSNGKPIEYNGLRGENLLNQLTNTNAQRLEQLKLNQ